MPFLTEGCVIATDRGELPAEALRLDDRVITRDNGLQALRWIGKCQLSRLAAAECDHLRPLLLRRGGLDGMLPESDMQISPSQRVLAPRDRSLLHFEEHEALVSAKHMVGLRTASSGPVAASCYIHLLFDRHELILANGIWTEAFHPGDISLNGMGNAQRFELYALYPELQTLFGEGVTKAAPGQVIPLPQRH
ncbi:Hint domain-containing protein [Defluviimonas sp. WL0002]|uniref:Hint domain-containing protein n=1 Tax=Albidovulum marisflavi TaxID=2984159 RepID=A0ABT2ZG21_9RHOB|nr:Hint domain-containing protein [Defluviimonas sp. WL0002]MCV2870049.1 Hint domain-containing protein [Defluviimonas sp. WL0002]